MTEFNNLPAGSGEMYPAPDTEYIAPQNYSGNLGDVYAELNEAPDLQELYNAVRPDQTFQDFQEAPTNLTVPAEPELMYDVERLVRRADVLGIQNPQEQ